MSGRKEEEVQNNKEGRSNKQGVNKENKARTRGMLQIVLRVVGKPRHGGIWMDSRTTSM